MPVDVTHLLSSDGAIARRLDGYEPRPQQVEMAAAVESAMERNARLLVEAGTGVGKSFAYLIPAIKRVVDHGDRVVIATNTINLQEQLIEKDIPLLNAVIPDEFSAVLVKGRGNYVSMRRLRLASERQDRLFSHDEARHSLHIVEDWAYSTTDGTLSTLPRLPRMEVWDSVRSDSHNCMGRKCPNHDICFYQAARRRMENGDLLICNHALFFADLALRAQGVGFLPPYQHVVLDEAHGVEEIAAEHFGLSLAESRVKHLLSLLYQSRTGRGFLSTLAVPSSAQSRLSEAVELVQLCGDAAGEFFDELDRWQRSQGPRNGRIREAGVVNDAIAEPMKALADVLKLLRERVDREADEFELNSYAQRAQDIARDAELLIQQQLDGCVYWVDGAGSQPSRGRAKRYRRMSLNCMAVDVAPILRQHLFEQEIGVVMTSATLTTTPGNFEYVRSRLGCDDAETIELGSPFDHARQMRIVVDRSMPAPSAPDYVDHLVPRLVELIDHTDGGAWILFTSFAMLERTARALRPLMSEADRVLLVQREDGPPGVLVKRFRDDRRSVLLGTSSFWQGVDVRGDGLRNVIITRLPFDVPDRPLVEARHELIRADGDHPFTADQIPRAIIRFRQGVGRLIRSSTDHGLVAVLDPRIVSKPYGRAFLESLPEGVRVDDEV